MLPVVHMGQCFCSERRVGYKGNSAIPQAPVTHTQGVCVPGKVVLVKSVVLYTGCSRTLVRSNLVSQDKIMEGEVVAIYCAHGDTMHPLSLPPGDQETPDRCRDCSISYITNASTADDGCPSAPRFHRVGIFIFRDNQPVEAEDVLAVTARAQFLKQAQHDAILDQTDIS